MEKLGQLRGHRRVGPDRGGHPAVTVGAGLPGRSGPAGAVSGRSHAAAAALPRPQPEDGACSTSSLPRSGVFSKAVQRVIGAQLLSDLSGFVGALDSMFGGFRERAEHTYRVLQDPQTAFILVAAPEPDAIREACYFAQRLVEERMPLAGLVLNRVHRTAVPALSVADSLAAADGDRREHPGTAGALRVHADLMEQVLRERRVAATFTEAFPGVPVVEVPAQPTDVNDLDGCARSGRSWPAERGGRVPSDARRPASGSERTEIQTLTNGRSRSRPLSRNAASNVRRQLTTLGCRRSSARRSRSVMPPQTPNSMRLSSASARHSYRTGQPRQTRLAMFCSAPCTNSASGSPSRHAAKLGQSAIISIGPRPPSVARLPGRPVMPPTGSDRPACDSRPPRTSCSVIINYATLSPKSV